MSSNQTGIQWRIGDHVASAMASDTPVLTRGETVSLRFIFEGGKLHDDGTMHADGTFHGDLQAHYGAVRDRLEYTDSVVKRGVAHNGVPWIRERLPERASIDSQVVLIDPGDGVYDTDPFWAAIVGGSTDHRPSSGETPRWVTLELFVLADADEYINTYGEVYGTAYDTDRHAGRKALLDDLGGEVV